MLMILLRKKLFIKKGFLNYRLILEIKVDNKIKNEITMVFMKKLVYLLFLLSMTVFRTEIEIVGSGYTGRIDLGKITKFNISKNTLKIIKNNNED